MPTDDDWSSHHIWADHRHQDGILLDAVRPLMADLTSRGPVRDWFFIRHSDTGPHLRLRARPADALDDGSLRRAVTRGGTPARIERVAYRFDRERFGPGTDLVRETLEAHANLSSRLALALIGQTRDDPDGRCWLATRLAARAVAAFPSEHYRGALAGAAAWTDPGPETPAESDAARALGNTGTEPAGVETVWLEIVGEVVRAGRRHLAIDVAGIVLDCVHMLNNRLGVGLRNEAVMYRVLARTLGHR